MTTTVIENIVALSSSKINNFNREIIYDNSHLEESIGKIKLSLIHFNDIYNIESRTIEPVGGASRFVTAINNVLSENPSTLIFFSGDAFNPSMCKYIFFFTE